MSSTPMFPFNRKREGHDEDDAVTAKENVNKRARKIAVTAPGESQGNVDRIGGLPDDVLLEVAGYLTGLELGRLACTCRSMDKPTEEAARRSLQQLGLGTALEDLRFTPDPTSSVFQPSFRLLLARPDYLISMVWPIQAQLKGRLRECFQQSIVHLKERLPPDERNPGQQYYPYHDVPGSLVESQEAILATSVHGSLICPWTIRLWWEDHRVHDFFNRIMKNRSSWVYHDLQLRFGNNNGVFGFPNLFQGVYFDWSSLGLCLSSPQVRKMVLHGAHIYRRSPKEDLWPTHVLVHDESRRTKKLGQTFKEQKNFLPVIKMARMGRLKVVRAEWVDASVAAGRRLPEELFTIHL